MIRKLRPSGGYRKTASFQVATIIYDATVWFCDRFLRQRPRTAQQMRQAARSGRQNIAEGSRGSATSSQFELKLLNVARSSQEELLLDYEDFLRHRHKPEWKADSAESKAVRNVPRDYRFTTGNGAAFTDLTYHEQWALYAPWLEHHDPAIRANALICLINQLNYLLDKQIAATEKQFIKYGGYREQLAAARRAEKQRGGG